MRCASGYNTTTEIHTHPKRILIIIISKAKIATAALHSFDRYYVEDLRPDITELKFPYSLLSFFSAIYHFAEPLRIRFANSKRRSFRVRGCKVEAGVAEVVFRRSGLSEETKIPPSVMRHVAGDSETSKQSKEPGLSPLC